MTLQIVSSDRSRAENASHLTRCVPLIDLNFSSNILFQLHGAGSQEAGMIKSVGSVFENSVIADCSLGHLFNMCPFLEPAANMIYRRNLYVNVTTTGAGATGMTSLARSRMTLTYGTWISPHWRSRTST